MSLYGIPSNRQRMLDEINAAEEEGQLDVIYKKYTGKPVPTAPGGPKQAP